MRVALSRRVELNSDRGRKTATLAVRSRPYKSSLEPVLGLSSVRDFFFLLF